ncbi:hypothetical protein [Sulfurifustis variabilis]|nr:hypothetical protein [Sulfurifustis variabilis]
MHNLIHARLIAALFAATLFLPAAVPAAEAPVDLEPQRLIAPEVIAQRDFALHLASALGVRIPDRDDPAAAVRALEERGIAPRTGWEPDEAVTPQTIAELRDAVAAAASAGRIKPDREEAVQAFEQIVAQLGLPLPIEPPRYAEDETGVRRYEGACDPGAYDDYYGSTGIPPYTYCPPPPAYFSMYAWVGSPFYWDGYYFPGFYTLRYPYVIVFPREPVPPPRFSEGVIGGARPPAATPVPPGGGGPGFRDTPIVPPSSSVPRAIPLPDRGPRFSEGALGGQGQSVPRTAPAVPPASSPRVIPSPRPPIGATPRSSPPPAARPSPAPSPAPPAGGGNRGWRDVIGK